MVEPATKVIAASPPSPPPCEVKKEVIVIDISSPPSSPPKPIMYLKRIEDMKRYEEVEDCFILGFDPTESVDLSKLAVSENTSDDGDDEVSVIAETGECYCYVCDSLAPCKNWTETQMAHCDASEIDCMWLLMRRMKKEQESQV